MKTKNHTFKGRFPATSLTNSLAGVFMACSLAISANGSQVVHTYVPQLTAGLAPQGAMDASQHLHLVIGLPIRDSAGLTTLLQSLYDPSSPHHQQWITPEQAAERFGATEQDVQAVADWATSHGLTVTATHANRLVIEIDGAVEDIQKALHVTLNQYQHPTEARSFYAPSSEPSLDLAVPVLTIDGLDNFAIPQHNGRLLSTEEQAAVRAAQAANLPKPPSPTTTDDIGRTGPQPNAGSGPSGNYAGCDFRAAYAPGVALNGAGQNVGLVQFANFYPSDITAYESAFGLPNAPVILVPVGGGAPPPSFAGNDECSLDIEMVIAMAPGASVYVYSATNLISNWVPMLSKMQTDNFCKQLSSSWFGGAPNATAENLFQIMAAQGQSFFCAAGDHDAWTNVAPNSLAFPLQSPNITLVGGTSLTTTGPCGAYSSESVWNIGLFSGAYWGTAGGIATDFSTPWWQASTPVAAALGSTTLRNIPDVALTAINIWVNYGNGASGSFMGTSCSSPLWAGFTALVNQQAMGAGRAPVGFLNPALYTIGNSSSYLNAFHDTTVGNNFWPGSPSRFPAVAGYDLCTGWGTPNGQVLINLLAGDPAPPSLLANGGFETGNFADWVGTGGGFISAGYAHSGAYGFASGIVGVTNAMTQTFPTIPGRTYVFSFWLENQGAGPNDFQVKWNGGLLTELANAAAFGWTRYQFLVVATGTSSTIEFDFRQDPSFWGLDDVGVTPAPEIQATVANPGFETGTFAGWTQAGNTGSTFVGGPPYNHNGLYGATFGPVGSLGSISQTIQTVPGQRYILSFWLDNPFGGTGTEFKALWNGATLTDQVNPPPTGWVDYHYTVAATGTTAVVEFDFRQDPSFWGFDDVSVSPIYDYQGITFDDLPATTNNLAVPFQYGGVMWYNFYYLDGVHFAQDFGIVGGYTPAVVSPVNVAYDGGGTPAVISNAVPFNLNSAMLTAAWNDNLNVQTLGYLHGALIYSNNYTLSAVGPTLINFNYRGVDQVVFTPSGGTPHPGYTGSGTHFCIDNVIITTFQGLTFDDLPIGSGVPVPNGYGDLEWNNFDYLDGVHFSGTGGYTPGAVSHDSAAYNPFGTPASIVSAVPFNFDSAFLTAAWNDGLQFNAKGYYHGVLVYNQTWSLSATVPTLINFNFANVTEVDFSASGGTPHPGYSGSGTHFVIDNITTSYPRPQFDAAYLRSSSGEPWGRTDSDTAMNRVFGTNHWQDLRYDTVNPVTLFSPATHFVYMEGSEYNWHDMFAFLNGNRNLIEGWVNEGGYLFVNAAPNEGTGGLIVFDTQIYATNVGPVSATGTAINPANPIFNGPFTPVGTSWSATFFAHATVVGDGSLYPLINGTAGTVLGELWPGLGHVMVGAMTESSFHSPQPQGNNLRANILAYAAGARGTAEVQGTFDDLPGSSVPVPNGYLGVNWNNVYYGTAPANSGYSAGLISSPNIGYNAGGTAANINSPNPFDLHSAYFTAAWNDNLQLRVQGYNRGVLIYDQTYTLQSTMPTLLNFDFLGVTEVDFTTSGGVHHAAYTGAGTHFAMDNILISTGDAVASGIDHFVWNAIPSPECMGTLFPVTITAKDGNNNTVTTFNGNVSFNAWSGVTDIDNFDTGVWPHAPWVSVEGGGTAGTGFTHDGASALQDPGWYVRNDVAIGNAGDAISWWVRPDSSGRAYLGFAAVATNSAWSVVAAPNTSQFIIQQDSPLGTGYNDVAAGDQTWLPGKWYKVQVVFTSSSSVTANLYDSDGITLLNTLSYNGITGAPGGVAIRSFGGFSLDTLQRGNPVLSAVLPPVSGNFTNGIWSGTLQTPIPASSMILTAVEGLRGQSGQSIPFTVAPINLTVTKVAGGVNVCWNTCVGGHYQLQQKSGNILNPWSNVGGVLTAGGAQICTTVAEPPPPWNFFRVVVVP